MSPSCQSREIPGPALCAASGASGSPTLVKYVNPLPWLLRDSLPVVGVPAPQARASQGRAWCQQGER